MEQIKQMAETLWDAKKQGHTLLAFSKQNVTYSQEQAYQIQKILFEKDVGAGLTHSGYKMGLTSRAKQVDVGVHEPIRGYLLKEMETGIQGEIDSSRYVQPRIEPEVVVTLKAPLKGPEVSLREVVQAIRYVGLAIEILDSRYEKFQFKLNDVIADNTSAAGYCVGRKNVIYCLDEINLAGVNVFKNGELVQTGAPVAVLGDPLRAVASLVSQLHESGAHLESGSVVLTGGITASVPITQGDFLEVLWPFESLRYRVV